MLLDHNIIHCVYIHTLCFINKNPLTMVAHTLFIKKNLVPKAYYAGGNDDKWARCASRVDRKFSFGEISMVKGPLCLRSSCMYSDAFEHWKFKILIFEKLFYRGKNNHLFQFWIDLFFPNYCFFQMIVFLLFIFLQVENCN